MYDEIAEVYKQIFKGPDNFHTFCQELIPKNKLINILDIGCGPGTQIKRFAEDGHNTLGIDPSREMIETAGIENNFKVMSLEELPELSHTTDQKFDFIYCIGNTLSYLSTADQVPVFEAIYHLLNKGGVFLVQIVNWDSIQIPWDFPPITLDNGSVFSRKYTQTTPANQTSATTLDQVLFSTSIVSEETATNWDARMFPRSKNDLENSLVKAGFTVKNTLKNFKRTSWDTQSGATIVELRKA